MSFHDVDPLQYSKRKTKMSIPTIKFRLRRFFAYTNYLWSCTYDD